MQRGTKESEDELEPIGRRTRATVHSVTDSPLRRSTRNRHTTKDDSSPDSVRNESVTSDGSTTKTKRRRTPTLESMQAEPVRNLRSRKTSTTSDVSETTESEVGVEGKRMTTRRSSMLSSGIETPTKTRLRRATRAGSESKTMSPMVRVTRRTRASSVDPEAIDDRAPTTPSTPVRNRKQRASAHPSEPPVFEEAEKLLKAPASEEDEVFLTESTASSAPEPSPKAGPTPASVEETREALESSQESLTTPTTPKIPPKSSDTRQKLIDNALKDLPKVMVEKTQLETSPGNKENEKSPRTPSDRPLKLFKATSGERKSLGSTVLERLEVDSRANIGENLSKSRPLRSKLLEKVISMESDISERGLEDKEDSIIFIDDTDTDEAPVEVFRNDKSPEKGHKDDAIIIAAAGNDDISPCKSQTPEADGPGEDVKPGEEVKENSEGRVQSEEQDEASLKSLFKDIPAEDWQSGSCKSPVHVEDDEKSDAGSDLVLVGWSADENDVEDKPKENFNYDSDETVIVQKMVEPSGGEKTIPEENGEETEVEDEDEDNLQRRSPRLSRKSTDGGEPAGKNRRSGGRKSLGKSKNSDGEEEVTVAVQEQLNRSRDLIYGFESGIIDIEESVNKSRRSFSEGRKSVGKTGEDELEKRAEGPEGLDKSRRSSSSELRTSWRRSKSLGGERPDEAMDVDDDGDTASPDACPRESQSVSSDGDDKSRDDGRNSRRSKTSLSSSGGIPALERHEMSPAGQELGAKSPRAPESLNKSRESLNKSRESLNKSRESLNKSRESLNKSRESLNKSRKSLSRRSVDEAQTPDEQMEMEDSVADEEERSSNAEGEAVESRRNSRQSELRVTLSKLKTPVKNKRSSSLGGEEGGRKSLSASKTPPTFQNNEGISSSEDEDEDEENVSKKLSSSRTPADACEKEERSSSEETEAKDGEDDSKVEELLEKSRSLRRSLSQPKSNDEKTPRKRNSLAVEGSSSGEDDEVTPEVQETLEISRKSLRRSTQSKQSGDDDSGSHEKTSQEIESIDLEQPSSGEEDNDDDDEITPEMEELKKTWRNLRKSLNASQTPLPQNEEESSGEVEKKSPQKRKSMTVEGSSSEKEEDDEKMPELEESLNKSRKSLRKSLIESQTPSKPNGNEGSRKSEKISPQKRQSLAAEESSSEEETPEVEVVLNESRKSLRKSSIESKTPSKQNEDRESKKSEKISPQKRKSLAVEQSSSEEDDEEVPEVEETLNKSRKSLNRSSLESKTPSKKNKDEKCKESPGTSPQKRKSLAVEESSSEEETPEVEQALNESRKSFRKSSIESKTPSKQNEAKDSKKSEKISPQKRKSLAIEQPSSGEDAEERPEVEETLNRSSKSLRRSSINSKTPKKNETEKSKQCPKTSPQKRKSLAVEESSSEDEKASEDLSTRAQVNGDSEPEEVIDSDVEQSRVVSSLFYGDGSDSSSDQNSDIEREYNLNGADVDEYSDDGVPGDDLNESESASEEEDEAEDFDDFINDEDEDEETEDGEADEDDDDSRDSEEEPEVSPSPPKNTDESRPKGSRKNLNKDLVENTSVGSATPRASLEPGKPESAKKQRQNSISELPKSPKPSTPSVPRSSENPKQNSRSLLPKKPKPAKKLEMNLTMTLDDSELVDTRLLMKEKLNDSMPVLRMKRMSGRRSDLQALPEDKSLEEVKEQKKKKTVKANRQETPEDESLVDVEGESLVSAKKSKKKMLDSSSRNESIKRKKSANDQEINSGVPKKKKIQVVKLIDSDSDDEPQYSSFSSDRGRKTKESVRATKEAKNQRKVKNSSSGDSSAVTRKPIKRLPEEILENLADVLLRPKKKRKINHDVFVPTRTMFDDQNKKPKSMSVDDGFMPISLSGGTTSFQVVSLKKKERKTSSSRSFRERMMNRVSRQPISAFMVHQQKLQASGKNKY